MQKPQESLDDFLRPIEPISGTPPSTVSLRPTGEVEVLSPLRVDHAPAKTVNQLLLQHGAPRISWFHRSLIFGGAAAAVVTIIFLSAVLIAVNETSDRASVDGVDTPGYESNAPIFDSLRSDSLVLSDETTINVLTPGVASEVFRELRADRRRVVSSRRSSPRVQRAAYITRRTPRPSRAPAFVPTTLVIFVENGEIKNRIEPTLTAAYKMPVSFSN